jgi:eukaryotic-like serine/threonine-protein kinase
MIDGRHDSEPEESTHADTRLSNPIDIGPYHVLSIIGAGGMGRVFRARDSKLNRDVALKLISTEFANDSDRLARFAREAQVLASLNHPNIGAIYGLEESDGRQALVLELVEGPTLATRIADGPIPGADALSIARQIADALHAAHSKGIIHRDLKPANIKVTQQGIVKVLDFGLAKTAAPDFDGVTIVDPPTVVGATRVGAVLGTAPYMSPEQARGLPVDARTDIWAFGCVLFEMLAGRAAFAGHSAADSMAKILEREPDWAALPKSLPTAVRDLMRQCLQKNVDTRLGSIAKAREVIDQVLAPKGITLSRWTWIGVGLAAVVLSSAGFYAWRNAGRNPVGSPSEWTQITRLDSATQPALSPDGRMLAFLRGPSTFNGPAQLYVKLLPDGEAVQMTRDDLPKMSPVFSPDGGRIAYTVVDGSSWDTWEVAAVRGDSHRWLRNASGLTWIAPNDLLYSEVKSGTHMGIVRSSEAREHVADLYFPPHIIDMAHRSYVSPDRSHILVVEMEEGGIFTGCRLMNADGSAGRIVGPEKARCTNAAWSPDGRWMYFTADAGDGFHLWRQRFPSGGPEQLTFGTMQEEEGLAVAADGRSVITSVGITQRSVWLHEPSGERQISLEGYAYFPLISSDGEKITYRVTNGVGTGQSPSELWVTELRSGRAQRLFPGQLVTSYDLSSDDRVVAAVREESGRSTVWLAWLDGREPPRPIPQTEGDNPRFASNGDIVFRVVEGKTAYMYRVKEDGTNRRRWFEVASSVFGTLSPDGEWLSSITPDNSSVSLFSDSGQIRVFSYSSSTRMRWTLDGKRPYLSEQYGQASAFGVGRTFVLPRAKDSVLPMIPPGGFKTEAEIAAAPGVESIPYGDVALASTPGVYAFSRITTTRNLYRLPLR